MLSDLNDHFFFSITLLLLGTTVADAAGYTCSTKQYTSCATNYYLTSSGAGNSCDACSGVSNTSSTQSGTESCTRSCSIENGTCSYSGSTRTYTDTCNGNYTGGSGGSTVGTGTCTGCSSYARTTTGTCSGGTCTVNSCITDYYASGCSCTSVGNGYYSANGSTNRIICTNTKPTNSSYTGSGGGENNCPWQCDANYYLNDGSCSACSSATFSRNVTESCTIANGTGTRTSVQTCYYTGGPAGAESALDCTGETGCSITSTGTCYVTSCNSGYHANASNTACIADVTITCAPGTYLAANATTCATCPSGSYYCPGGDFAQSSSAQGRKTCPTGYTSNTVAGKGHISACTITCGTGRRVAIPGGTCLSSNLPAGGWFTTNSAHTVGYGQVSPVYYCPNNFDKQAGTTYSNHVLPAAACQGTLSKGHLGQSSMRVSQIKIENGSSIPVQLVEVLLYGATGAQVSSSALSIKDLSDAYTNNELSFKDNAATIPQLITKHGSLEDIDPNDYSVQLGAGGGYIILGTPTSGAILGNIVLALKTTNEIRNYTTATTTPENMQLRVSVYDAQYQVWHVILDTTSRSYADLSSYLYPDGITMMGLALMGESPCPKGKYFASTRNVTYGTIASAGCTSCANWTYASSTGSTSCTACPTATDGWTKASGTGWTLYSSCKQTKNATDISSYCTAGVLSQTASSASSWGTASVSTAFEAAPGSIVSGSGASSTCTQCSGAVFSPGGSATSCTACPAQTSGWTRATGTGWSSYGDCYQTQTPANCASGTIKQIGSSTTTWGTSELVTALSANANSYVNGLACYTCASKNSTYPNSAGGAIDHTSCYSGTQKRAWSGSQTACSKANATVTCNSCSNATCDYVAYLNSAGTGDGTLKSGCSTNNAACQQTVKTYSCNANYYDKSGDCSSCSTDTSEKYPYSAAGATAITSCYSGTKSRAWSGSQTACSKANATVTCNTCSNAACSYVAYSNSAGTGDGTIKSGCSTNNAACQQTVKTYSCNANYYDKSGDCSSCSTDTSAKYPYSAAGATAITSCYSGTKKRAMTSCTQNACSNPDTTGCSGFTCAASCSCAGTTCDYVAYSNSAGTGDGTIKSGCSTNAQSCTKAVASLTAKANYYVNGTTSCPTCSSKNSGYPYSAGGNISYTSCYSGTKSRAWSGSQTACVKPDNSASYSCDTCAGTACDYVAYLNSAGTGDGTIKSGCSTNNTACQQNVKSGSVTCNANYYQTGIQCLGCDTVGDKTYTKSQAGNSGGAGVCFKSCSKACTQQSTPTGAYSVTHGSTSTSGTHYYGGSCSAASSTCALTVNSCKATYYKNGNGCSLCSGLSSAYANSNDGNSSGTGACFTSCGDGTWVASAKAACTDVTSGYHREAHNVSYGSTDIRHECPDGYAGSDGTRAANTSCYAACSAKTITGGSTTVVNAKEYYNGSAYPACTYNVNCNARYGASGNKTSNPACTLCNRTQYSAGGTATCEDCSNAPEHAYYSGGPFASSACEWLCKAGYVNRTGNQCAQMCTAGISYLKSSTGVSIPLYTSAQTTHSIVVQSQSGAMCYANLAEGEKAKAINVNLNGTTYHAIY